MQKTQQKTHDRSRSEAEGLLGSTLQVVNYKCSLLFLLD
jgi:hypothetical protein